MRHLVLTDAPPSSGDREVVKLTSFAQGMVIVLGQGQGAQPRNLEMEPNLVADYHLGLTLTLIAQGKNLCVSVSRALPRPVLVSFSIDTPFLMNQLIVFIRYRYTRARVLILATWINRQGTSKD